MILRLMKPEEARDNALQYLTPEVTKAGLYLREDPLI